MRGPPSYEELTANFDWNLAERELQYRPSDPINIGWTCCDRICQLGLANKLASGKRARLTNYSATKARRAARP